MRRPRRPARRAAALAATALLLASPALAACGDAADDEATDTSATAPAIGAGEEVERFNEPTEPVAVEVGQRFEIAMLTDPQAGTTWSLTDPGDEAVIELQDVTPSQDVGVGGEQGTGAGALDVFLFEAVGAGETTIELAEGSDFPTTTIARTSTVTIVVSD